MAVESTKFAVTYSLFVVRSIDTVWREKIQASKSHGLFEASISDVLDMLLI